MKLEIALLASKFFVGLYTLLYSGRVYFGKNVLVNHKFRFQGQGKLVIGNKCNLWAHEEPNRFFTYSNTAEITVGEGSQLNGVTIHCLENISLGSKCLVGSAMIMDTDFHEFHDPFHILYHNPKSRPIVVGNNVWLCGQCVLLKGSQVGDNSVVGFRAVVTKAFPADVVVAGNPAKIVKDKSGTLRG